MDELIKEIERLKLKEKEINKKIDELDSQGKFLKSVYLLPELFEIQNKIKELKRKLKFKKGPDYTDGIIDLYYNEFKSTEIQYYYDIYLNKTKICIGDIVYRENNPVEEIGDIGYKIDEPYRGHNYALNALNLIKNKILESGKEKFKITAYSDNIASIKTIEKFGGKLIKKDENYISIYECDFSKKK